jgi:hypothetical protein
MNLNSLGSVLAMLALVLAVVLGIMGQISLPVAGLIALLAVARLV